MIEIVPIEPDHIESFHRTLDFVAREQRYLAMLEAGSSAMRSRSMAVTKIKS
jgi:hypothetical protein